MWLVDSHCHLDMLQLAKTSSGEAAGLAGIALYDLQNKEHVVSIQDGMVVIAAIGSDYQNKFSAKQRALVALEQAETVEAIQSITFEAFL